MSADEDNQLSILRRAVLEDPRNGELRYLLAAELAQQHDYESAVLEFSAALALNPQLHVARLQLGLLHLMLAQTQHAATVLAPLEDLGEQSALRQFKQGLEALIVDDFSNCLQHLRRGIELNQDNEPLNKDMAMIAARVESVLAEAKAAGTVSKTTDGAASPEEVRTDFSLYGAEE